jgi:hypothetical protein
MPKAIATLLMIAWFARVAVATDSTEGATSNVVRIRPTSTQVAVLLLHGCQRSQTFRSLINRIEQRDVIVYIEMQPFGGGGLRGCLRWMSSTGGFRYVRVSLNPHQTKEGLIESLAHELQHAIEVTEQVQIVDTSTLNAFYRATGDQPRPGSELWDTPAARMTGRVVRRELATTDTGKVHSASARLTPRAWHSWVRENIGRSY